MPEIIFPAPGSKEVIAKGCTCPVWDNHHGRGYGGVAVCASIEFPANAEGRPTRPRAWCHTLLLTLPDSSRPMQTAY